MIFGFISVYNLVVEPLQLKYPLKSHRKPICIPAESEHLAELMGIIFGDGGINNNWQLVVTLNSNSDFQYSAYVARLIKDLFLVDVTIRKRLHMNALILVVSSMNLLDYLISKGAVRGNKINQEIDIPLWIRRSSSYKKAFVRGLVDTDGCLYIHKHIVSGKHYFNIGFCFTSFSENLIRSVAHIFQEFGIKPHIAQQNRRIYLYSERAVLEYLRVFGSSNPRITSVIGKWRGVRVV